MSEVDLEAANQQALKQSQERASNNKTSTASPNVNFAVQLKSASQMTNAKLRETAASAGINASGQSVISAAVKARGQSKSLTQQSPTQVATQQKVALTTTASTNSLAGNNKTTQTSPNASSVVTSTTASATSSSDAVLSSTSSNSSAALLAATNQMQEMNQQFNLQYLQLQEGEQAQNRQFTSLSNVSKLRSDTAKNSISNLK